MPPSGSEPAPAPNPILIVHGWSDNYESFVPLRQWLQKEVRPAVDVFLGDYDSMEDHVTFDHLASGLQARFDELEAQKVLTLRPYSLDVIVHSTGGPVIRHWLHYYIQDRCNGDTTRCPIRRLIMLAPANFGSRLAVEGKSALGKIFKGGLKNGFETGELILDGLELGSPELWNMALDDLFGGSAYYPSDPARGPYVFVFSGTETYGRLKGLVASGANEDGSDGTIRASSASLNSILLRLDAHELSAPKLTAVWPKNLPIAFRLVPGRNHSTIVLKEGDNPDTHPICPLIRSCLAVDSLEKYNQLRTEFDSQNAAFYATPGNQLHAYQQFVFHVVDQQGDDVPDYRIDFHVVDDGIKTSDWGTDEANLKALQKYSDFSDRLQSQVIVRVDRHSENASYRTFFIDMDGLKKFLDDLRATHPNAYVAMNLDAAGPTKDLGFNTDELQYVPVLRAIENSGRAASFFMANTTTLVEIELLSAPTDKVMNIIKPSGQAAASGPAGGSKPGSSDPSEPVPGQGGG